MAKDLESIVQEFAAEAADAAGAGLEGIVLYGSAATGDHVAGRSDLNFLLVARKVDLPLLEGMQKRMKSWARRRIAPPLVVDPAFLASSTDSYPLEILGMRAGYRLLRGSDPFGGPLPEPRDVRLQAEREAKSKTLMLRRGYLESWGNHRVLLGYLTGVLPAIDAILRGLLYVDGAEWKGGGAAMHAAGRQRFGLDGGLLDAVRAVRDGRSRPSRQEGIETYGRMLALLDGLEKTIEKAPGVVA